MTQQLAVFIFVHILLVLHNCMSVSERSLVGLVSGLPEEVTSRDLKRHFSGVGEVAHVFFLYDEASSVKSGTAYAVMATVDQAQQARSKTNGKLGEQTLKVSRLDTTQEAELLNMVQGVRYAELQDLQKHRLQYT